MSIFAPRKRVHLIPYPHGETTLCGKVSGLHSSHAYRYEGGWEVERYRRGYDGSQIWSKASDDDLVEICLTCRKIAEPMKDNSEIIEFIRASSPVSMREIADKFDNPQRIVARLVKSGKLKKDVYCYGSGGFDGLGFRTRPWTYVYSCV